MRPVLTFVPGWAFKFIAPALVAWGLFLLARALVARVCGDTERAAFPTRALTAIAIGVGLFAYSAPSFGPHGWTARWAPLPLYAYGVMLGVSVVVGWYATLALCERRGLPRAKSADAFVVAAVCAVLGARALYVVTNLGEFVDPMTHRYMPAAMLALRSGGLVAYGGFLAGLAGAWWYLRRNALSFAQWADCVAPSLAAGVAITRVGCYLYGCDFGRPLAAHAPRWLRAMGTFPRWPDATGSPAWEQQRRLGFPADMAACVERVHGDWAAGRCYLDAAANASVPVHPTQLYESALGVVLCVGAVWLWRRGARFPGQIALAVAASYGFARAGLEVVRGDAERGAWAGLSTSQWIGLMTGAACVGLYVREARRVGRSAPA